MTVWKPLNLKLSFSLNLWQSSPRIGNDSSLIFSKPSFWLLFYILELTLFRLASVSMDLA